MPGAPTLQYSRKWSMASMAGRVVVRSSKSLEQSTSKGVPFDALWLSTLIPLPFASFNHELMGFKAMTSATSHAGTRRYVVVREVPDRFGYLHPEFKVFVVREAFDREHQWYAEVRDGTR